MIVLLLIFTVVSEERYIISDGSASSVKGVDDVSSTSRMQPVNPNTAGHYELDVTPILVTADCLRVFGYRKSRGQFDSWQDLLTVSGMNSGLLKDLAPYVTVERKRPVVERFRTRIRVQSDIPRKPYSEKWYTKTIMTIGPYDVYFVTEKDPYESPFFDYYAAGLLCRQKPRIFVLGRYALDFGAGIVLSPFGSQIQLENFRFLTGERGIIPYTSVMENGGFFGAALRDSLYVKWTLFYSNQKLDGRIDSAGHATSFYSSGLHTDSLSISKKDRINEEIVGYDVNYTTSSTKFMQRAYLCIYEPAFTCQDSLVKFYGDRFWITSIGVSHHHNPVLMFSEVVRSFRDRIGGLIGMCAYLPHVDINVVTKIFPTGFYSPKGDVAEDDYASTVIVLTTKSSFARLNVMVNVDNDMTADSMKQDIKIKMEKQITWVNIKAQIRGRFIDDSNDMTGSALFLRLKPIHHFFIDVRFNTKYIFEDDSWHRGLVGSLELGSSFKWLKCRLRYCFFKTDSYASRIYVYEVDLPGIMKNRMFYNEGTYGFLYCAVQPQKLCTISTKFSVYIRSGRPEFHLGGQLDFRL